MRVVVVQVQLKFQDLNNKNVGQLLYSGQLLDPNCVPMEHGLPRVASTVAHSAAIKYGHSDASASVKYCLGNLCIVKLDTHVLEAVPGAATDLADHMKKYKTVEHDFSSRQARAR